MKCKLSTLLSASEFDGIKNTDLFVQLVSSKYELTDFEEDELDEVIELIEKNATLPWYYVKRGIVDNHSLFIYSTCPVTRQILRNITAV